MIVRRGRLAAAALCLSLGGCASSQPPSPTAAPSDESGRAASPSPALANSATSTAPGDADARLGAAFSARFAAADATALWAVRLERLGSRAALASHNEDRLVLPASNMKIVTLAAAATRLGWDYRFRTHLYGAGVRDRHVLHGDLVVVGGADPTIGRGEDPLATFRGWAQQLRAQGLRRVDGDLVGDAARYGEEWLGDSWSWEDLPAGYSAPYSGLTFNENVVRLRITPGPLEGAPLVVTATPVAWGLHLNPQGTTARAGQPATLSVSRGLGSSVIDITGAMPAGAAPVDRVVSVSDPARYFLGALRAALAEAGIEVRGNTRVAARPDVSSATPLLVHESAPLSEVAQRFMKASQNLYGEVLLRVLSASAARESSPAGARSVLQDSIAAMGVPTGSVQGLDGSGLSRRDFVTARAITTLLQVMARPPHRAPFKASLPVAAADGTIAGRFKQSPCAGRLFAKTGTLSHARALSGYITSASGNEFVFSVIANNFLAPSRDIDAVVEGALALVCAS